MTGPETALRVAVIGGGRSCEHEVSLASAAAVGEALSAAGHQPVGLTIDREGLWRDHEQRPVGLAGAVQLLRTCDVAWPVLHGPGGEDGTAAALCELAQVAYVGSGVAAGAVAMDKWATKLLAEAVGVPTAPSTLLTAAAVPAYVWTHPVVVKPVAAGSSHGVTLVERAEDLSGALDEAFSLGNRVLVEDFVIGREIDVAVLGRPDGTREVPKTLEILVDGLFDYATKYDGSALFRIPAEASAADTKALTDAAVAVYDALGCRGVARVDFFVTEMGLVLNEVNTMPGFTSQSQVPKMFDASGTPYVDLVDLLVRDAVW